MGLTATSYLAAEWFLIGLCLFVICTRLAVRRWKRIWSFWLSEVFLILAFLSFLTLVVGDTYSFSKDGAGLSSYYNASFDEWIFASNIVFDMGFYFPRFSLLAFYNELFPISESGLRKCLYVIMVYNFVGFLIAGFLDLFWCGLDISQNWAAEPTCTLLDATTTLYINWSIGIVAELLIFALPFGMLRRLKSTPLREKMALSAIFAIGIISIASSVARITFSALQLSTYTTYLIGSTEIAAQIITVALPALRPLLPVITAGFGRIPTYLGSSRGGSSASRSMPSNSFSTEPGTQTTQRATDYSQNDGFPTFSEPQAANESKE